MLSLIIGVVSGLIALSPVIISRRPDAASLLTKVTPYIGWIGVCVFGWGVRELIWSVLGIAELGSHPIAWAFGLGCGVADFSVGLLLGFGLISKYALSKNAAAMARGEQLRVKLAPWQAVLGGAQIVLSVLYFVF